MKRILNKIQTGIILLLAAGTPVVAVLNEKFWFEKRVALAAAAVVLLALWASRTWRIGRISPIRPIRELGWLLLGAALLVAAVVPAGRVGNLATPELWVGLGAVVAYFAIRSTLTNSRTVKLGFFGILVGALAAAALATVGIGRISPIGPIREQATGTLQLLQSSPILGEFREFRLAQLGILQIASGLGILGVLGTLALVYQIALKSVKGIVKSSGLWWRLLNILVLFLLAAFLVLPNPALTLWPLAVVAALAGGIGQIGPMGPIEPIRRALWAVFVGVLVVVVLGASYGLGRAVWGELKFREAVAAANRNEGITTYYALLDSIKRNPYEVRYHLLASQIDIALANSIAAQAAANEESRIKNEGEATPSAGLTAQDQNNIMVLIQQAVVEGKAAINLDPENSALWQNLASIYRSLIGIAGGAEDWALKCYQRAAELNPQDPNPPLQLGTIHFVSGNYQGAVDELEKALKISPDWPSAHYNLAVVFNAMGEVDKAIEQLQETLNLLPGDSPDRPQVEKDLEFLKGEISRIGPIGPMEGGTGETEGLKEATSSAEVEAPPPPVGPEASESAETKEPEGL